MGPTPTTMFNHFNWVLFLLVENYLELVKGHKIDSIFCSPVRIVYAYGKMLSEDNNTCPRIMVTNDGFKLMLMTLAFAS
jgi:hypothetical protein